MPLSLIQTLQVTQETQVTRSENYVMNGMSVTYLLELAPDKISLCGHEHMDKHVPGDCFYWFPEGTCLLHPLGNERQTTEESSIYILPTLRY